MMSALGREVAAREHFMPQKEAELEACGDGRDGWGQVGKGKRCYSNKVMSILSTQLPPQVTPSQKAQIFANCDVHASCISSPLRYIYPVVQTTAPSLSDRDLGDVLFLG